MNRGYIKTTMNDEGNADAYDGDIGWGFVHKEGLGVSKNLREEG